MIRGDIQPVEIVGGGLVGRVFAAGRRPRSSRWFGLKLHARRLPLGADLEVHLASRARLLPLRPLYHLTH
jgi:hypothetical protein